MDAKYYCQTVSAELTAIKARLYSIIRQMENASEEEKEVFNSEITSLNTMVDDLTSKVEALSAECPTEWSEAREGIENTKNAITEKINQWDMEHIAGGYVGG